MALFLRANDLLPTGYNLDEIPVSQTRVGATTIIVAFAAGIAGMLAVETRAGSAIGVAISVTTIPAAAYLGVAIAIGEIDQSSSGFAVLGTNVAIDARWRITRPRGATTHIGDESQALHRRRRASDPGARPAQS